MSYSEGPVPITQPMRVRARELGVAALERLDAFGMDDRRESAFALLLAGAVPLAGMHLLGWAPAIATAVLLLNLLLNLVDDLGKIVRARWSGGDPQRDRVEDEFVWPVARAMLLGRKHVYGLLPDEDDIARRRSPMPLWFALLTASATCVPVLMLLLGEGSVYQQGRTLALGTAPSVLLVLVTSALHRFNHHPHWRRAGSVRLQGAAQSAYMMAMLGGYALVMVVAPHGEPAASAATLARVSCVVVLGYGLFRVWCLLQLRGTARWLRQSIRQMGAERGR